MGNANRSAQRKGRPITEAAALDIDQWFARQDAAVEETFKALKGKRPRLDRDGSGQVAECSIGRTQIRQLQLEALKLHRQIVRKMRVALMESEMALTHREREWAERDDDE